jgi:hypothetical protein
MGSRLILVQGDDTAGKQDENSDAFRWLVSHESPR